MSDKPEVFTVQIQVTAPSPRGLKTGAVAMGAYIISDGHVIMTDSIGDPITDRDGNEYRHKLAPGDNPKQIAGRLTKKIRDADRGKHVAGFDNRPLIYPFTFKY